MLDPVFQTLAEVIEIHSDQIRRYGGHAAVRDQGLLESALAQPEASFAGEWLHQDAFTMAAAYTYHICQNHPFIDGNKRAGLACALVFLEMNGVKLLDAKSRLEKAVLRLSSGEMTKLALSALFERLAENPRRK